MRILHLGDTHLGTVRRAWNPPEHWTRADDHMAAMRHALAPAMREEVDLVVHAGDVFNRSSPPRAAVMAGLALLQAAARRVPVVVLAGNHDRLGLRRNLGPGGGQLHVIDLPTRLRIGALTLALVPHRRDAAEWAAAAKRVVAGGVDLLVTHQAFAGARVPGLTFRVGHPAETLDARHLPPRVPAVLNGHIHPRQVVPCRDVPVVYPGSTERTSFSESHDVKGVALWDLGRAPKWRFHDLPTRPMVTVRRESDLARVRPGTLVGIRPVELRKWAKPAADRGGIVALPPDRRLREPSRAQIPLFGA
jgi:DNA repair exonuclease SbcCD nuclease subunit